MRLTTPAALCLSVAGFSNAHPAPRETSDEIAATLPTVASTEITTVIDHQLAELAKFASDASQDALSSSHNQKRPFVPFPTCLFAENGILSIYGHTIEERRKSYISAIQCFTKKQANTPKSFIPGAISRFDDSVGTHINQTNNIHYTGIFLAWHRYFTWAYEQALRKECGYTGTQPYWDWSKTAITGLTKSPIFDGSDASMSGNGEYIPGNELGRLDLGGPEGTDLPPLYLPTGYGGGCGKSGPFRDMTLKLGPVSLPLTKGTILSNGDGFAHNPRCLKRDLTDAINQRFANATYVVRNILAPDNIWNLQMTMQGTPGTGDIGIHGGGHYSIDSDPARDIQYFICITR